MKIRTLFENMSKAKAELDKELGFNGEWRLAVNHLDYYWYSDGSDVAYSTESITAEQIENDDFEYSSYIFNTFADNKEFTTFEVDYGMGGDKVLIVFDNSKRVTV